VRVGESLPRGAKRETKEETGFEVRVGRVFHAEVFSSLSKRGKMRRTVGIYFHCVAPARKTPQLDPEEHSEYAWVALADLNDYPTIPYLSRTIRTAFATRIGTPRLKEIGGGISVSDTVQLTLPVPA